MSSHETIRCQSGVSILPNLQEIAGDIVYRLKPECERIVTFGEDAPPLLTGRDGKPLSEAVLAFVRFDAVHMYTQARLVCRFRAIETGQEIRAFFKVSCTCEKRFPSYPCRTWKPKGSSSTFARAAAVMYGRRLRKGDKADPKSIFGGKLVVAQIIVVAKDRDGEKLPLENRYSKIGPFLRVEAGGMMK